MGHYPGFLISPLLFLAIFLYLKIRYPKGEFSLLIKAFFWGVFLIIPVVLADQAAHYLNIDGARSIRRMFLYSFVVVAFTYELAIFLPLRFSITQRKHFKGPADGIIYSVALALGLTSMYIIYYSWFCDPVGLSEFYFWSMGPMNIAIAVVLGFFTGLGKMRKNQFIDSMTGLGAATLFQGIYRFAMLSSDEILSWLFVIVSVFIAVVLMRNSLKITAESE